MSWCHNCGAEYRAGFSVCADCDLPLHDTPPPAGPLPAERPIYDEPIDNDVRTTYFGKFGTFEAEIVLEILREAGIFALAKHPLEDSEHHFYSSIIESERGVILIDANRVAEARMLIDEQLPAHLQSIEDSMRTLNVDEGADVPDTDTETPEPADGN
jgi:hypothetical protein